MPRGRHEAPPRPRSRSTATARDSAAVDEPLARSQAPAAVPLSDADAQQAPAAAGPPVRITRSRSASLLPKTAEEHGVPISAAAWPAAGGVESQQLQGNDLISQTARAASLQRLVRTPLAAPLRMPVPILAVRRPLSNRRASMVLANESCAGTGAALAAGSLDPDTSGSEYVADEVEDDSADGEDQTVTEESESEVQDPVELLTLSARVPTAGRAPAQRITANSDPTYDSSVKRELFPTCTDPLHPVHHTSDAKSSADDADIRNLNWQVTRFEHDDIMRQS